MKTISLIIALLAITMIGTVNAASSLGQKILADEVVRDFMVAAIETVDGERLLTKNITVDGKLKRFVRAKKLLDCRRIQLVGSRKSITPNEIKYLFARKSTNMRQAQGDVAKEPHTDGWPINNGGGGRK
ncbi:MAG: hypothetical protein HN353_11625 [Bdellovibrionales bacterium]|jgi:hypothetical protein|nr:hypothetical protein [Bdellovibrionales bacterium]MBT3526798.1 hypothetical protein [Bdellovibrionales bacterium]MBT7669998.1 hypothetical protein [Bdellovibrionales bacterium]MBT7768268.1 hypothetical protein [Bdellovibrionales bacterium]